MGCVYEVMNISTGAHYIGMTARTLKARMRGHFRRMREASRREHFLRALRKYGIDDFVWMEVFWSDDRSQLAAYERALIALRKTQGIDLYNITEGGDGAAGFGADMRQKIAARQRGRKASNKGVPHSEATKQKISAAKKGTPAWNKGRSPSPETVAKMLQSRAGYRHSEEIKRRMSETRKGRSRIAPRETPPADQEP